MSALFAAQHFARSRGTDVLKERGHLGKCVCGSAAGGAALVSTAEMGSRKQIRAQRGEVDSGTSGARDCG